MTSLVRIEAERAARLESELLEELYQAEEHDLLISACSIQMEGSHQHISYLISHIYMFVLKFKIFSAELLLQQYRHLLAAPKDQDSPKMKNSEEKVLSGCTTDHVLAVTLNNNYGNNSKENDEAKEKQQQAEARVKEEQELEELQVRQEQREKERKLEREREQQQQQEEKQQQQLKQHQEPQQQLKQQANQTRVGTLSQMNVSPANKTVDLLKPINNNSTASSSNLTPRGSSASPRGLIDEEQHRAAEEEARCVLMSTAVDKKTKQLCGCVCGLLCVCMYVCVCVWLSC